jgi:hypothetical protein
MKVETVVNGHVTTVLIPENPMEEHILKALAKQDNDVTELRGTMHVLGKNIPQGSVVVTLKDKSNIKSLEETKTHEEN